ncbi:hypothetical protein AGOR_G00192030 [Albula goreensis]|uniref:Ig-like domain-containing protein n=1 Tax=Albula goreensis TaxID=1534307 RepID=A0A8T3CWB9_9TELE|nr:hypothetical protein AGOR_G00192030 [Albula goreensis]
MKISRTWKNWLWFVCYLARICTCSSQTTQNMQWVKGIVGGNVTFNAPVLIIGSLLYEDVGNIAMVFKGSSDTEIKDQFKDRLQWDSQTGLFTITQLKTEDSGTYKVDCNDGQSKLTVFKLTVYNNVSMPTVTVTVLGRGICSVLCSVENGREVTLSWQREGEILNHTSSPDLNTTLSLPLETGEYRSTYRCVAANPVSSLHLEIPEKCQHEGIIVKDEHIRTYVIPVVCSFLSIIAIIVVTLCLRKRSQRHTEDTNTSRRSQPDVYYAEITHNNQRETQCSLPELDISTQSCKLTTVYDELRPHEAPTNTADQC